MYTFVKTSHLVDGIFLSMAQATFDGLSAELVAVILMTAMFSFFLLQIFTRYILNNPLSWTSEASTMTYIWVIFWGATFLLQNKDHVRFSILHDAPPHIRIIFSLITLFAIAIIFGLAALVHQ